MPIVKHTLTDSFYKEVGVRTRTWHSIYFHLHANINLLTHLPWTNSRRFADNTFNRIFLNENALNLITISLRFIPKGLIDNNQALV